MLHASILQLIEAAVATADWAHSAQPYFLPTLHTSLPKGTHSKMLPEMSGIKAQI